MSEEPKFATGDHVSIRGSRGGPRLFVCGPLADARLYGEVLVYRLAWVSGQRAGNVDVPASMLEAAR